MSRPSSCRAGRRGSFVKIIPSSPPLVVLILALPVALVLGVVIGVFSPLYAAVVAGAMMMVILVLLRMDEILVVLIVAVHILVDIYMNFDVYQIAMLMSLGLLFVCFLGRSADRPWTG